jgi:hypothetical protein
MTSTTGGGMAAAAGFLQPHNKVAVRSATVNQVIGKASGGRDWQEEWVLKRLGVGEGAGVPDGDAGRNALKT